MNKRTIKLCALIALVGLPLVLITASSYEITQLHFAGWIIGASTVIFFWILFVVDRLGMRCLVSLAIAFIAASNYLLICNELLYKHTGYVETALGHGFGLFVLWGFVSLLIL